MIGWTEVEGEAEGPIRLNEMNRKGKKREMKKKLARLA